MKSFGKSIIRLILLYPSTFYCLAIYAQTSDTNKKLANRDFPSVFQAWNKADNVKAESEIKAIARHDLYFTGASALKLKWNNDFEGLADGFTENSLKNASEYKKLLVAENPNIVTIVEIKYRDAPSSYLPSNSKWWMRDEKGDLVYGWEEGGYIRLDLNDSTFQEQIAKQAAVVMQSGVADGVMLDWWTESEFLSSRLAILKKIRKEIGNKGLILLNSNQEQIPQSAEYANGLFMECWDSPDESVEKWAKYQSTLEWAEKNLREPRINCLETWFKNSRNDLNRMRSTTTLALTRSNGFCLFSDPNPLPTPDHLHSWYSFYDVSLGKPKEPGFKREDNAWQRNFSNGIVIYNPLGNNQITVLFEEVRTSQATGIRSKKHFINFPVSRSLTSM